MNIPELIRKPGNYGSKVTKSSTCQQNPKSSLKTIATLILEKYGYFESWQISINFVDIQMSVTKLTIKRGEGIFHRGRPHLGVPLFVSRNNVIRDRCV